MPTGLENTFSGNALAFRTETDTTEDRSICELQGGIRGGNVCGRRW